MKPYYEHGGITIYHGDCTKIVGAMRVVGLLLTDPPYGIDLQEHATATGRTDRVGHDWGIAGDKDQSIGSSVLASLVDMPAIVFASPRKPWPGEWRQFLVWDKGPAVGGGGDIKTCWKFSWELIQVARTGVLSGNRDSSVLSFHIQRDDFKYHPAQKPTSLLRYLIGKAAGPDDVIVDPFTGSGSTLRAAKDMGRKAIGIEIEEKYCEIAANRLRQEVLW